MAKLDLILTLIFSAVALLASFLTVFCMRKAMSVSGERDGDLKMFLWAVGSLIGLIIAGMSAAYILLPILFNYAGK